MTENKGAFVISLDFEMYWGLRDVFSLNEYEEILKGVHSVIPAMLKLFIEHEIHATWATVGLLFFDNYQEMIKMLPEKKPGYKDQNLSPYEYIKNLSDNADPFHYATELIGMIKDTPNQEIGTHTFSHYYCLEPGQDLESFRADLKAAVAAAEKYNIRFKSMAFPKNQINQEYLTSCSDFGIIAYRDNPDSIIHWPLNMAENKVPLAVRALRLIDSYISLTGNNSFIIKNIPKKLPIAIPYSRFLRPYRKDVGFLENLRLRRILSEMTYAAKNGRLYHIWWHPYNFGDNQKENLSFLAEILKHYLNLKQKYGMESWNMQELAEGIMDCSTY